MMSRSATDRRYPRTPAQPFTYKEGYVELSFSRAGALFPVSRRVGMLGGQPRSEISPMARKISAPSSVGL